MERLMVDGARVNLFHIKAQKNNSCALAYGESMGTPLVARQRELSKLEQGLRS